MANPKNKWQQPAAPPGPMFFGKKERDLVKQVNDELAERVIGQPIAYYPISIEESNFSDIYGEAIDKISLPPVRVFAYVVVDNEQTNERYGYEYQTKLTVNFSSKRLTADQDLFVRVGDFVQYGDQFYEIVKTYNDTRYYFGQVEHKFQISAECIRARTDAFRVMPGITRPTGSTAQAEVGAGTPAPRPAPYPPLDASYVVMGANSKLPSERVLTAGDGITITDGGANSAVTIAATGQNAVGPTGSLQYQTGGGSFSGSTALVFDGTTLVLTGSLTASADVSASAFFGDGSNLTGIAGSPAGSTTQVQYNDGASFGASANFTFDGTTLLVTGSLTASADVSASAFFGDGSNLTGIVSSPGGSTTQIQFNNGGSFDGSANLTFDGTTVTAAALQVDGNTTLGDSSADTVTLNAVAAGTSNTVLILDGSDLIKTDSIDSRVWGSTLVDASGTPVDNQIGIWTDANTMEGTTALTFDGTNVVLTGSLSSSATLSGAVGQYTTLSASLLNLMPTSGSLAGTGSYLGLDANNNVILSEGDGSTTSPAGSTTELQYNNGGAFGASSNLTYDGSTLAIKGASHLSGGVVHKRTTISSATYSILLTDYYLGVDTSSNPVTLTLPAASSATEGQTFVVKDEGGSAGTNILTVERSASDTIDGLVSIIVESDYGSISFYTDGANWFIY